MLARTCAILAAAAAVFCSSGASAEYPERSVKIIMPFGAGSATDTMVRIYADLLSAQSGQTVYVENKGSPGGVIGALAILNAPPDGYTAGVAVSTMMMDGVKYDPLRFSFSTLLTTETLFLVVSKDSPVRSLRDLIASKPQSYAAPGPGHLVIGERFKKAAGIDAAAVRYAGDSAALADLMAQRVPYGLLFGATVSGDIVRPLAVMSRERSKFLPEVPPIDEALKALGKGGFEISNGGHAGIVFPPGTPANITEKFSAMACKASKDPSLLKRFEKRWTDAVCSTPEEFRKHAERMHLIALP